MRKVIVFYSLIAMLLIIACSKSENEQISPNVPTGKMIKELTVNGITREYIIHVPANYASPANDFVDEFVNEILATNPSNPFN
jgi:poly(3-hydroxybutyrate) depolymerase